MGEIYEAVGLVCVWKVGLMVGWSVWVYLRYEVIEEGLRDRKSVV